MSIRREVDAIERERSKDFLDYQFFIDVIEDNLSVKPNRAHKKLVKR